MIYSNFFRALDNEMLVLRCTAVNRAIPAGNGSGGAVVANSLGNTAKTAGANASEMCRCST